MFRAEEIKADKDWKLIIKLSDEENEFSICGRNIYWRLLKNENVLYASNDFAKDQNLFDYMNEEPWYEKIQTPLYLESIEKIRSYDWLLKFNNGYTLDILSQFDNEELVFLDKNGKIPASAGLYFPEIESKKLMIHKVLG